MQIYHDPDSWVTLDEYDYLTMHVYHDSNSKFSFDEYEYLTIWLSKPWCL